MALSFKDKGFINIQVESRQIKSVADLAKRATGAVSTNVLGGFSRVCQAPFGVVGTIIRGVGGGVGRQNPVARFGNWICEGDGTVYRFMFENPNKAINN